MRTFLRSELDAANAAWDAGDFSPEWREVRHKAAMGGLIYPPSGTKHDSWEDDSPSQRAILIRAIRETPALLGKCIIGAPSWFVVIERLTRARDEWREELDAKERHAAALHRQENPTHRESVQSIRQIFDRIEGAR
jgi:hypothetical protein